MADAETHYSEKLVRLEGLGAFLYRPLPGGEKNPAKWREQIRTDLALPNNFHLYLCPQALFKFHPRLESESVVGGWWSVVGGLWLVVGGWWSVVGGRWSVVGGRWSVVSGQWSVVGGRWSGVGGQ